MRPTFITNLVPALVVALLTAAMPAQAMEVNIAARFTAELGMIADAALLGDGNLALLYAEEGRIAKYSFSGELAHHIVHEGGAGRLFKPTACLAEADGGLLVFDEAAQRVYAVAEDGNIGRSFELAYPVGAGSSIALSRVSNLATGPLGNLWVMLTAQGKFASFDRSGRFVEEHDLSSLLPYDPAIYTRASLLPDGSLFVLEYSQGAILYSRPGTSQFNRIRIDKAEGVDHAPVLQDFAVDSSGIILAATYDTSRPLVLLTPATSGYTAHSLALELPVSTPRLACRQSKGKFIVWLRDTAEVVVLDITL